MNRQQQEKIISLLDVAGSTIVDIFYNHMYDRAIAMKEKTEHNITDCYRSSIIDYVKGNNTTDFYKVLMNSIHYYTKVSTVYHDISLVECIDLYASLFVPDVYLCSMTEKQKNDVLSMVLRETIGSFSAELLSTHLSMIIDEHQDETNVKILQDLVLKELIRHRDESYLKFIRCEKKLVVPKPNKKVLVKSNKPQKALVKLTRLYKEAINDKVALKQKNTELQLKYKTMADQFKSLQTMLLNQIQLYKTKDSELVEYKKKSTVPMAPMNINTESNSVAKSSEFDDLFNVQYISEE